VARGATLSTITADKSGTKIHPSSQRQAQFFQEEIVALQRGKLFNKKALLS
jgi:hypothetical protein